MEIGFPSFRLSVSLSFRKSVYPTFRKSVCPSFRPLQKYVPCVRNSSYSFIPILFETLQVSSPCFEDVHVVWI